MSDSMSEPLIEVGKSENRATVPPRIGFIGAGRHSSANLYPALELAGVSPAGVADRNPANVLALGVRVGAASVYRSYREMIEKESLDGVVISVDPAAQPQLAADCLAAGIGVFVEKPFGMTAAQAQELAALAADSSRPVVVGFMKRFAPAYVRVGSIVRNEELGAPRSYGFTFGFAPWKPDLSIEEFIFQAVIHLIDLSRHLFGPVEEVTGFSTTSGSGLHVVGAFRHRSGVVGTITFASAPAWSQETEELLVTCDAGYLRVADLTSLTVVREEPTGREPAWSDLTQRSTVFASSNSPASGATRDLYLRGYAGEMQHFVDVLRSGQGAGSAATENVETMRLCERLIAAVTRGTES